MNDRVSQLREAVEQVFPGVDGVLALKKGPGDNVAPHLFHKERPEELDALAIWPKEPLPGVLRLIQRAHPDKSLAVVCRGCEERGIVEMAKHTQVDLARITLIGLQCVETEARACRCARPYTAHARIIVGEQIEGVADPVIDDFLTLSQEERLAFWKEQFLHCIKCYGCRNICPQCFCDVCVLEDEKWVQTGRLPMPRPPMYHLIRAMHMAAKCVGCRECEETCPAGIPLGIHFRLIARDVEAMFGYDTGAAIDETPPLLLSLQEGELDRIGSHG